MSPRVSIMTGLLTIALMGFVGGWLVSEGRYYIGGGIFLLAAFRAAYLFVQIRQARQDADPPSPPHEERP